MYRNLIKPKTNKNVATKYNVPTRMHSISIHLYFMPATTKICQ